MSDTVYIADANHYNKVLSRAASVKSSLWIATADIKDLHVRVGQEQLPFLGVLAELLERAWRYASCMPRNRARYSERISTDTRYLQRLWNGRYAPAFISS